MTVVALLTAMALFASLNAQGLRSAVKLESILDTVVFDVLCLQETKWDDYMSATLTRKWHGHLHVSNSINKMFGVAIYFKLDKFKEIKVLHKDSGGRLLVTECKYCPDEHGLIIEQCIQN